LSTIQCKLHVCTKKGTLLNQGMDLHFGWWWKGLGRAIQKWHLKFEQQFVDGL
jgi:hypothetical protein